MLSAHVKLPAAELHACVNLHNLSLAKNRSLECRRGSPHRLNVSLSSLESAA